MARWPVIPKAYTAKQLSPTERRNLAGLEQMRKETKGTQSAMRKAGS